MPDAPAESRRPQRPTPPHPAREDDASGNSSVEPPAAPPAEQPALRRPVPPADAIATAEKAVRSIYTAEYASKDPA